MLNIAIVDDETSQLDNLSNLLTTCLNQTNRLFNISTYDNGVSLLVNLKKNFDLIFLDVEMDMLNGIQTAKKIREVDDNVLIIFVTNYDKFAIDGYSVNAYDYILKPVSLPVIKLKMKRILNIIDTKSEKKVEIKTNKAVHFVAISKISYVESLGHDIIYHTSDGIFKTRSVLTSIGEQLKEDNFAFCSSSFLVNLAYITKIENDNCYLSNSDCLKMTRTKKKQFLEKFDNYIKSK